MENGCSISPGGIVVSSGLRFVDNIVKCVKVPMDIASESILINSESSKDDSLSSYDDATRNDENGIDGNPQSRPTITLAKSVTLRNFESMSNSLVMEQNKNNETLADPITLSAIGSDMTIVDPLANSIILSESDGETTGEDAFVRSEGPQSKTQGREATSDDSPILATKDIPSTAPENDSELVSSDNTGPKRPLKVVIPTSTKKSSDGIIQPVRIPSEMGECLQCNKTMSCSMMLDLNGIKCYICSEKCMVENRFAQKASLQRALQKPQDSNRPVVIRKCGQCKGTIVPCDNTLSWETMDFCNEDCLKLYQNKLGLQCSYCKLQCQEQSLGKYCVRFGFDIRQFCHSSCLEEYKKGIKVCSFCQEDIPANQGFMAAINDRQHFKEFCSDECMKSYDKMSSNMPVRLSARACDVCNKFKLVTIEVMKGVKCFNLCSDVCFNAFKFVHPSPMGFCDMCRKHFDTENVQELLYTFSEDSAITFCSKTCMNAFVVFKRKIVQCNWCKVKKYNFDMIKKVFGNRQVMMLCSFHCFSMWKQSPKRNTCDHCKTFGQIQYHLGMSDGTLRSFCGHECLMKFQLQFKKVPVTPSSARPLDSSPTLAYPALVALSKPSQVTIKSPSVTKKPTDPSVVSAGGNTLATICAPPSRINDNSATIPVISSVTSLEPSVESVSNSDVSAILPITVNTPKCPSRKPVGVLINKGGVGGSAGQMLVKQQLLLVPSPPKVMCNKSTFFCSQPTVKSKGIFCRPNSLPQSTQTDFDSVSELLERLGGEKTTKGDKKKEESQEEIEEHEDVDNEKALTRVKEVPVVIPIPLPIYIPVPIPMYSIPLPTPVPVPVAVPLPLPMPHSSLDKILNDIQELCIKLPKIAASNRRRNLENGDISYSGVEFNLDLDSSCKKRGHSKVAEPMDTSGGEEQSKKRRKLEDRSCRGSDSRSSGSDAGETSAQGEGSSGGQGRGDDDDDTPPPDDLNVTTEKPSSPPRKYIKCEFGVNAWKKWVKDKNEELTSAGENPFNTELLWLSEEDLSRSLVLFVQEFRKPSGEPFSPDIIFYLVLGIQAYLLDNGRINNIFTDPAYDKFTDTFNEMIVKETLVDNSELLVPRIEEEHLWESCQLGFSSPFSLLLTMLYFTTKGFNITDVDTHMSLAFSQLMREWPRGQSSSDRTATSKLKYFPPNQLRGEGSNKESSGQDGRKKLEIVENLENDYRCPVFLYSFYLSKCPTSMRNRSDIFYLQPEKSYSADSPLWYSCQPLDRGALTKMFNRLRLVKEISLVLNSQE